VHQLTGGEVGELFLGRGAAKHGVAMRLAAEARDDVAMVARLRRRERIDFLQVRRRLLDQRLAERDAALQEALLLGMAERQHEEGFLPDRLQLGVVAALQALEGQVLRQKILGVGLRGALPDRARELLEDDDQREPGARRFGPAMQLAAAAASSTGR